MKSNRREFIQYIGTGTVGLGLGASGLSAACASAAKKEEDGQYMFIGDNIAIAETAYGKVRGFIHKDIYNFLGIPYGANTTGKNRFMPAQKPEPWTEIYPAVYWPNSAPQLLDNFFSKDRYLAFTDYWHYDDVSENCLGINVWTPGYNDNTKRPVLLWIHGGGYTSGNSIEHPEYHGENLSSRGNVVVCSLNHRLGPLGFSNFAGVGGEKYTASANIGMLDIVFALEWIRDNIANFGGDPDNVTIMGQSGGAGKVTTLTGMPVAKGLFHRAVVLSGGATSAESQKESTEKLGAYILKEAGLSASQIDKLQEMPWRDYFALTSRASAKFRQENPGAGRSGFTPIVDGTYIPLEPFYNGELSANVPMIICSTTNETSPSMFDSSLEDITLDQAKEMANKTRGFGASIAKNSAEVIDAYAKLYPDKKPIEILSLAVNNRKNTIILADGKSKQPAPVFLAWFGWNTPMFDGRLRAFHTMDIGFWLYNTDVQVSHTGGGARPRALAAKMSDSLVQFMKTGDPNGGGLPQWPRYTSENGETMFLDDVSEAQNDPDREARRLVL